MASPRGPLPASCVLGAAATVVLALSAACRTVPDARRRADPSPSSPTDAARTADDRPFRATDVADRERAERWIARLSSADEATFSEAARALAALGERAVPALVSALGSDDALTRAHAALVLGVLLDRRTIPDLARVAADDPDANARCEAGRSLLAMGDPRGFDPLIAALSSDDARRRTRAIDALSSVVGRTLGFEPDGALDERAAAIRRWNAWRERQRAEQPSEPEGPAEPAKDEAPADPSKPTPRR